MVLGLERARFACDVVTIVALAAPLACSGQAGNNGAPCAPECTGRQCGNDGCGSFCGTCTSGTCNTLSGQCVASCTPNCSGRQCGTDGCGGSCGKCGTNTTCNTSAGQCVCTPNCSLRQCGSDGCGGSCGTCGANATCDTSTGQCICTPDCTGRACGPDPVCGTTCGPGCDDNNPCTTDTCLDNGQCAHTAIADGDYCYDRYFSVHCTSGIASQSSLVALCESTLYDSTTGVYYDAYQGCTPDGAGNVIDNCTFYAGASVCTPGSRECISGTHYMAYCKAGSVGGAPSQFWDVWDCNDICKADNYLYTNGCVIDSGAYVCLCTGNYCSPSCDTGQECARRANGSTYCCTPNCAGKTCGDDGCGGNRCGSCNSLNQECVTGTGGTTVCQCRSECVSGTGDVCCGNHDFCGGLGICLGYYSCGCP
jgi:hypothetical protein